MKDHQKHELRPLSTRFTALRSYYRVWDNKWGPEKKLPLPIIRDAASLWGTASQLTEIYAESRRKAPTPRATYVNRT